MMCRVATASAVLFTIILQFSAPESGAAASSPLGDADARAAVTAFKAIEKSQWKAAHRAAAGAKDPLVAKIVRWMDYSRRDTDADFGALNLFMAENPAWPLADGLRRRAEEAMPSNMPPADVLAWFGDLPPLGIDGMVRRAEALLAAGGAEAGRAAIRDTWINGNFNKRQEQTFYRRHRKLLTRDDHAERLERLIWADRYWDAQRMLWRVDAGRRALAEARLMLMRQSGGVDTAIAKVPAALRNHPGLIYERLRWRRQKGRYESARELLENLPDDLVYPRKWWTEREILARWALDQGYVSEAYRIARDHGLAAVEENAAEFAEAEWLAGWIALRSLGDFNVALDHFTAMYQIVRYPISRARGAYWTGRAAEALETPRLAKRWYAIAAGLPTTYYGQLAATKIDPGGQLRLPADPQPTPNEMAAFSDHELVRVIRILHQIGESARLRPFITALVDFSDTPGWHVLTAALAHVAGRPDVAIHSSKMSGREGHLILKAGYPEVPVPAPAGDAKFELEPALALAVVRQESAFWAEAISPAGARGLMQLMPTTAKPLAMEFKLPYDRDRLIKDPAYNMKLGVSYLARMIDQFDGSYVLALAAYNAGPSRARAWVRKLGDPRNPSVDAIDWIEAIPFAETRNYIQRVLENLQVYRSRLADTQIALALEKDLVR